VTSKSSTASAEDLVAFFRSIRPADKQEYEALAALDREFGEDVLAERRARRKREES